MFCHPQEMTPFAAEDDKRRSAALLFSVIFLVVQEKSARVLMRGNKYEVFHIHIQEFRKIKSSSIFAMKAQC